MLIEIAMGAAFVAATLAIWAVLRIAFDSGDRKVSRLERRLGLNEAEVDLEPVLPESEEGLGRTDRALRRLIHESGSPLDAGTAALLVLFWALAVGGSLFVLTDHLLAAAAGVVLGASLPVLWWAVKRHRRLGKMRKQLPEALQMFADAARAGRTLQTASELVSRDIEGPLSTEFQNCAQQLELGHSPISVFQRMVRRIPLPEFRVFATAVIVHQQSGGNLPLLAERMAHAARERQEFRGHLQAVTAGSRLSAFGLVIGSVLAVGVLAWIEPTYVEKFATNEMGPMLIMVAAGLQLTGIFWVWRIMKIQY